ncbi:MAG: tol-pal system YbgF family protein [bacterium]
MKNALLWGWVLGIAFTNTQYLLAEPVSVVQDRAKLVVNRAALNLYKKALDNYEEEVYWKSALDLIVLLDYYPKFSKMDGVVYHLGSCLYEMDMFAAADRLFRYLLKATPRTPLLPKALLGLQKIYYKRKNYRQSLKFYKALEAHYSHSNIIGESRYYAGQSYYYLKNYNLVPEILGHVGSKSEFYPFALYTTGLAQLKKKMSEVPYVP